MMIYVLNIHQKTIEQNQQKNETNFIGRLLGSLVHILLENRKERKFNEGIKDLSNGFYKTRFRYKGNRCCY
jgi:hypothetical protein